MDADPSRPPWLIAWAAETPEADGRIRAEIAARLRGGGARAAAELAARRDALCRPELPLRGAVVARTPEEGARAVERAAAARGRRRPVALLLPGHGSQHPRMAAGLYGAEPAFTTAMDDFFRAYGSGGERLRREWLSGLPLDAPETGQPLLYAVGVAMAAQLRSWGVRPQALVGHSIGEFAAATEAGVLTPAQGAWALSRRADAYALAPEGSLLAVAASAGEVSGLMSPGVVVGVVNGPQAVMLAGPRIPLEETEKRLRDEGFGCVQARIPVPFHSPAMEPLARSVRADLERIPLRAPRTALYSTRTGRAVDSGQTRDPGFWAEQVALPVLFDDALARLLSERRVLLVEAGPGRALTTLARRRPEVLDGRSAAVHALPGREGPAEADRAALLGAAARIWTEGHAVGPSD
ncbi:acyltransferase domain-containing protein [Nocardiopsis sp. RSe5-2]|uniref:Acyltransferase domain-containing protein n=1 Tax=Nocardiopsis endophytica TaxID=3018445 RepID=A0ABT4U7M6_9ACTN|nr:acyltransferase domain-containing protein [Nocardiopsis endophytica]MDA2812972.1 acyltransferase domain-containing protein [Nocardiopsis endophytica]